jgi:hypothetical protein
MAAVCCRRANRARYFIAGHTRLRYGGFKEVAMSKKRSWDEIAREQYLQMDEAARDDWRELRAVVYGE